VPASSTAPAFLAAFKAALTTRFAAHGTLSAVRVDLIPTGDTSAIDAVTLVRAPVRTNQSPVTFAKRRSDAAEIPGSIFTYSTGADSDVAWQASWDRAALILDEIILELRDTPPTVGDQAQPCLVTEITYEPQTRDQGGWVTRCDFTIEYGSIVA